MSRPRHALFAEDFREEPWWWHAAPPEIAGEPPALPPEVDLLVVGAGYTGLSGARTAASAGRSVLVLDSLALGAGASTMNAGFVGRVLKHGFRSLLASHGAAFAKEAYGEADNAFRRVFEVVGGEGMDCHLKRCGRFIGALTPEHLDDMTAEYEARQEHLGTQFQTVPRERVPEEIGSPRFCGGIVIPDLGSLHPAEYLHALLASARRAGATVVGHCPVRAVRPV
ncbi:MAG: FAD-binding oxidoreductase, partial [Burkholderiales bacterium]|nr:FAD-binding oxidoreductase [Burkholderiales bacterium]